MKARFNPGDEVYIVTIYEGYTMVKVRIHSITEKNGSPYYNVFRLRSGKWEVEEVCPECVYATAQEAYNYCMDTLDASERPYVNSPSYAMDELPPADIKQKM